jgi:hypothetical protein
MFAARSIARLSAILWACVFAPASFALTIDLSLNVFYTDSTNINSGGSWQLVAKSQNPGTTGIAGVSANIANINNDVVLQAPRGTVNGANPAGFRLLLNSFHPASPPTPAYRELAIAQVPISPLPGGSEQALFYGVGTLQNGSPDYPGKPVGSNSIGPTFTSLTGVQDVPWAIGDPFGNATWNTAAVLASGSFPTSFTPSFVAGNVGNVFTTTNSATFGDQVQATPVTTVVRTNFGMVQNADYNDNGIVDAADYPIWRKTLGQAVIPIGSGADGNNDGFVTQADFDLWRAHFGNPFGSGTGSLSTNTVPEPATGALVSFVALLASFGLRRRRPVR